MVFFLNLIISILYSYAILKDTKGKPVTFPAFCLAYSPLVIIWLLICGGQYYVGSDYPSYIDIFNGRYIDRYEPGFIAIIKVCLSIGFKDQILYYLFYAIGFTFLFLSIYKSGIRHVFIFILLYITITGLFNNQLNILRQAISTYIATYGVVLYLKNLRRKGLVFIVLSSAIHYMGLITGMIVLTPLVLKFKPNILKLVVVVGVIGALILSISYLNSILNILPANYAYYLTEKKLDELSLLGKITKFILCPFYIWAIAYYDKMQLNSLQQKLFKWGIASFALKLFLLNIPILNRVGDFFVIISIFPLYYLCSYFYNRKLKFKFYCMFFFCLFIYFVKTVVFPSAEYYYQSIYPTFF